jgi:hypothetical protein
VQGVWEGIHVEGRGIGAKKAIPPKNKQTINNNKNKQTGARLTQNESAILIFSLTFYYINFIAMEAFIFYRRNECCVLARISSYCLNFLIQMYH